MNDDQRFRSLPEPVALEDTVAVHDVDGPPPEQDDEFRENAWLLKTAF